MLAACSAMLFTSCSDKDGNVIDEEGYNSERLMMPMFRLSQNTGHNANTDPYGCGRASMFELSGSKHVNDIWLNWYEVDGASGYRLQAIVQGGRWEKESDLVLDVTLPAGTHSYLHKDLAYGQGYLYAIQAISPRGEQYNSKWYGKGDSSHQKEMSRDDNVRPENYGSLVTGDRYLVPELFNITEVTDSKVRIEFNYNLEDVQIYNSTTKKIETFSPQEYYKDFLEAAGKDNNGSYLIIDKDQAHWAFDRIEVTPSSDNSELPAVVHEVTPAEKAQGYVEIEGLVSNALYVVSGYRNGVDRYYDSNYNKVSVRMHGEVSEPYIVKANQPAQDGDTLLTMYHVPELIGKVTRLDTVLINYMSDNKVAEGRKFYLEGGQTYYIQEHVDMTKGFTLETNPEDLAAGKGRATVYLGVGYTNDQKNEGRAVNFSLSRNAKTSVENGMMFTIGDIVFNNINFQPQIYYTYNDQKGKGGDSKVKISGNYFINMYSQGLAFSLTKLEIKNCTMNGLVRGFVRFQGPNKQLINALTVDNCVFYDCGNYSSDDRGYSWFAGPGNQRLSNFYKNLTFTNNSIIDCPRHALVTENGLLSWPNDTKWNIKIENNTFLNAVTSRTDNKSRGLYFELSYAPSGSKISFKKNLIVFARKGDSDARWMYQKAMIVTTQNVDYDIADNYSTFIPSWKGKKAFKASDDSGEGTKLTDGIFTNNAFSDKTNGAGKLDGKMNVGGMNELKMKFGDNHNGNEEDAVGYQLKSEDLFKDPQPLDVDGTKDMFRHNVDGFYYNLTERVKAHPIYTKKIGDQRWATGAPWK